MANLFGDFLDKFKLSDEKKEERIQTNQIATTNEDGAIELEDTISQYLLNVDWAYNTQADMINTYREIANYNVVDYAIEDVINEMVSFGDDEDPIDIDLSGLEDDLSENIRNKIYDKWEKINEMLDLKDSIHRRARQFYTDGRLSYQKVIDKKKPNDGLLDIIELDSRFVTKVRNKEYDTENKTIKSIEEYYIYDESAKQKTGEESQTSSGNKRFKEALRLDPNAITYVTSGLTDMKTGYAISWLHKAVKPANQLRMMENALVIYRITRAPERRVFYVDVANMPKTKAEQYLRHLKNMYRNKMSFDSESGQFKDTRHLQTMQEDYWLPRNSSGKGTEVDTLPGGSNLGDIEDVVYFQKQLYKALNIPVSRLEPDSLVSGGRGAEISRDELKFSKFVSKIRKRFNIMLLDILKTELILTKVMTIQEWDKIKSKIEFRYAQDMYLEELRKFEMERERLDLLQLYEPYIGKFVSNGHIRREVLKQSELDMEEMDKEIKKEKSDPQYKQPEDGFGGI